MAFTAPTTRATDFLVTAAVWNAEHVDNFNTAMMHLIGRKTSDQSVTSSTVLVDATSLGVTVAANEVWIIEYRLRMVAGTAGAGGYKLAWTFPTSGEVEVEHVGVDSSGVIRLDRAYATTSPATGTSMDVPIASASVNALFVHGFYVGGGNAGTVQLQFSQYNSSGTATTMKAQSTVWGVKLA